jgi:addiction module RelE/StbE family toxin
MAQVIWTEKAVEQVEQLASFIEQDSIVQARRVVRLIVAQTRELAQFPRLGRMIPEIQQDDCRELLIFSYRILYRIVDGKTVAIVGVVHGRQLFDSEWVE